MSKNSRPEGSVSGRGSGCITWHQTLHRPDLSSRKLNSSLQLALQPMIFSSISLVAFSCQFYSSAVIRTFVSFVFLQVAFTFLFRHISTVAAGLGLSPDPWSLNRHPLVSLQSHQIF